MFNFLDIVFGGIALFFLLWGMFRGLLKEITSTLGVLVGYFVASNYNEMLVPFFQTWFKSSGLLHFLSYVALFVGVMFCSALLGWLLVRILRVATVFWVDVPGGAVVGLVKAWVLCCAVFIGLNSFLPDAKFLEESALVPYLRPGAELLEKFQPDRMKNFDPATLREKMEEEKGEALKNFLSGSDTDEQDAADPEQAEKSMDLLKKMGDALKNLSKEKKE